ETLINILCQYENFIRMSLFLCLSHTRSTNTHTHTHTHTRTHTGKHDTRAIHICLPVIALAQEVNSAFPWRFPSQDRAQCGVLKGFGVTAVLCCTCLMLHVIMHSLSLTHTHTHTHTLM